MLYRNHNRVLVYICTPVRIPEIELNVLLRSGINIDRFSHLDQAVVIQGDRCVSKGGIFIYIVTSFLVAVHCSDGKLFYVPFSGGQFYTHCYQK